MDVKCQNCGKIIKDGEPVNQVKYGHIVHNKFVWKSGVVYYCAICSTYLEVGRSMV